MENCRVKEVPLKLYTHLHENTDNLETLNLLWPQWPKKAYLLNLLLLAIFSTPEQTKWKSSSCSLLEFYPMSLKQDLESPKPAHASFHNAGDQDFFCPSVTRTEPWIRTQQWFLKVSEQKPKITPNLLIIQQHFLCPWHFFWSLIVDHCRWSMLLFSIFCATVTDHK